MNSEKYFANGFLLTFSGLRPIDSLTYRRAQAALHAVEGIVAGQALGPLDQTADRWLRRPGKQSDIRRLAPHRKTGGPGCIAATRILKTVPARTKWLQGSVLQGSVQGRQGFFQETSAMRAIQPEPGLWLKSIFKFDCSVLVPAVRESPNSPLFPIPALACEEVSWRIKLSPMFLNCRLSAKRT